MYFREERKDPKIRLEFHFDCSPLPREPPPREELASANSDKPDMSDATSAKGPRTYGGTDGRIPAATGSRQSDYSQPSRSSSRNRLDPFSSASWLRRRLVSGSSLWWPHRARLETVRTAVLSGWLRHQPGLSCCG